MFAELTALVTLAETGSMERAANDLLLTPSAFTRRIQRLESELGVELVDRHFKPLKLTQAGYEVLEKSRAIISSVSDLKASTSGQTIPAGPFRLGLSHALARPEISKVIIELGRQFPLLQPSIGSDISRSLLARVHAGDLDAALVVFPMETPLPDDLQGVTLAQEPMRLVESCNLIDQLNAGRLVVVFGPGFKDTDLVAFGRDFAERNTLFEQGIRTVVDIWGYDGTGGPLEFAVGADRGKLTVPVNPSSFRKPRPILARATLNQAAIADTAARGWPVFTAIKDAAGARAQISGYHAALQAAGHDAETIRLAREWSSVGKAVHVAETDEQARSEAEAYFNKNPSGAIARNPDDMITGSPETVTRKMREFVAAGVGVMICGFLIDLDNLSRLHRSVRLFKEQVIPGTAA